MDGHDMRQVLATLEKARERTGRPTCVIARTVKGKGVSFMEDKREWHGKPPSDEERRRACEEIEGRTP
jgi:transketolase